MEEKKRVVMRPWKEEVVTFLLKVEAMVLEENLKVVETEMVLEERQGYGVAQLVVVVVKFGEVYLMVVEGNFQGDHVTVGEVNY